MFPSRDRVIHIAKENTGFISNQVRMTRSEGQYHGWVGISWQLIGTTTMLIEQDDRERKIKERGEQRMDTNQGGEKKLRKKYCNYTVEAHTITSLRSPQSGLKTLKGDGAGELSDLIYREMISHRFWLQRRDRREPDCSVQRINIDG